MIHNLLAEVFIFFDLSVRELRCAQLHELSVGADLDAIAIDLDRLLGLTGGTEREGEHPQAVLAGELEGVRAGGGDPHWRVRLLQGSQDPPA